MNNALKIALYAICVVLAVYCGGAFLKAFSARMDSRAQRFGDLTGATEAAPATEDEATNQPAAPAVPPTAPASNLVVAAVTNAATNIVAKATNATAVGATTNRPPTPQAKPAPSGRPAVEHSAHLGLYGALALGGVLGLALLIARDVSHFAATRTHQFMYNEEGKGIGDPLYDQAEQTWANGDHLEAIRLLREYLKRNPRELHARLRIAEIYEKDLNNALAAALEYEEILQTRFDADRWGWSAIHLCNLYARLNQPAKMDEWMQRIVNEVPETSAARKAREKLGLPEDYQPTGAPAAAADSSESVGGMPPGFRPKKG